MEFIKYFSPGSRFDSRKFADVAQSAGIMCFPVEGGVIIDREKVNSLPVDSLPAWIRVSVGSINNPWCTGVPTDEDLG